ncbi:glycosyltransferase family 4 protein [Burkholderia cepacia]|uniref:glycosyltransferase family 4 protein n=1 Tax=Burkholderia cepacia TaxID=292 RepID=UPI000B84DD01|nr:glycosyltransferase family 1 protein [Burkholderia cepacia]MDN7913048.1 glycosyltransferase family 1 protein [Burkholderia cepacia]
MRLILSVDAISPPLTGIGRYTWELAHRYAEMAAEFESLRFYRGKRWIVDLPRLLTDPASVRRGLDWPRLAPRAARNWAIQRKMRTHVFHSPNYFLPDLAESGVVTIHDLSVFRYAETHPLERVRQFERSFASTLARASHLITDTDAIRDEVCQYFGWSDRRISTVGLGVSRDYRPRDAVDLTEPLRSWGIVPGGYALCVSTLEPRKRVDHLIDAYGALPERLRELYPLVLAGGHGWLSDTLREQIAVAERAGWLKYVGFVSESELPLLYAGARAFFFPSLYEGFGLPVLEAMSSGVPVLTSNCSSLPEVTDGAARLVEVSDRVHFIDAIQQTLLDDGWRTEAIKRGLAVAARYDWRTCANQTLEVCRQHG